MSPATSLLQRLLLHVVVALVLANGGGSSGDRLQGITEAFSTQLWDLWSNTSLSAFEEAHHELTNETVESVNGSMVAEQLAHNLSLSFSLFRQYLNETAEYSEGLYSIHQNRNCCSTICQYGTEYDNSLCSMSCNVSGLQFISSGRGFGTGVNDTSQCLEGVWSENGEECLAPDIEIESGQSAVHIPRDVHEQDPDVLCFVQWTEQLNQQFSNNHMKLNYSNLTQYVGSNNLLRFYPPSDWSSLSQCNRCPLSSQDTYDLGRRPWYRNTVSGVKYIIILLDVSGSMAGFQSLLARTTISEILSSLTSNDYFHIIQVGEGMRTKPISCFSNKTRSTPENVLVVSKEIMSLSDTNNAGRAEFTTPLRESLLLLGNSTECHRVLIIFSDGERETSISTDLVKQYNSNREVQVFSFLMGSGGDDANLKAVACQNRGRMKRISEYFDVIPAVILITNSLQLPDAKDVHYTSYRDIFHGNLALTMGLPLWTESTNETFGVVGFDIPHKELLNNALQTHNIGASGYGFIVDINGQVLNHPSISNQFIQDLSDDSLLSLDVDYFENLGNSTQWAELREAILSRVQGETTIENWTLLRKEEKYTLKRMTYSYHRIEDTPFVVVIVTPEDLLVVLDSQSRSENNETLFSPIGGCGQCSDGCGLCEGLRRVEGGLHSDNDLIVYSTDVCSNQSSSVTLLRPLVIDEHVVGVVGHTHSADEVVVQLLQQVVKENEALDGDEEIYILDEHAFIVSSYPYNQRGWFPGVYQEGLEMMKEYFDVEVIVGYEPRPRGTGASGVCDNEEEEEEEWRCDYDTDCPVTKLYVREIEIYQLKKERRERTEGELNFNCTATSYNTSYVILKIPNTTLTMVTLYRGCLRGNDTGCYRQPLRYRCLPCICGSEVKFRGKIEFCPSALDYAITSPCSGLRPHPSLLVSMATTIIYIIISILVTSA